MSAVKHGIVVIFLLFLICALTACAVSEPFDAGEPLTPGEVNALRGDLIASNGNGEQIKDESKGDTAPATDTVYWLAGGSVYHMDSSCHHIKEKPNVQSGTVAAAAEAGKTRSCSLCKRD